MSPHRDEADVTRTLRAASTEYDDLPPGVADRLDRVLDQLPTADTLHAREERVPAWSERLRAKRVRYALVSTAAAILLTIGGVAVAVQYVPSGGGDAGSTLAEEQVDEGGGRAEDEPAPASDDDLGAADEGEEDGAAPESAEETSGIATFSTGTDYAAGTDLLSALRDLGTATKDAEVPEELADLARGGDLWEACRDAIAARYNSLIVAVDFARYDARPAVLALLVSDSGEIAVAVSPACADGVIEELVFQQ